MNAPVDTLDAFVERYISMWNEGDPARRRLLIEELWTPDCVNYTRLNEYRGWDALEARVQASWEKWGRDAACVFRTRNFERHHDALRVSWEMIDGERGNTRSIGIDILLLSGDGQVGVDYQFVEP